MNLEGRIFKGLLTLFNEMKRYSLSSLLLDFKKSGVPLARWKFVENHKDLSAFGFPCFLKVDTSGGEHKTEIGAVMRCENLESAEKKLVKIHKKFSKNKILVQEFVEGLEMIVGVKKDVSFGRVLVVGFGGIFAEVERDVSFRALDVSGGLKKSDVLEMISELEGFEIFGARKKYALDKFVSLVLKVVKFVEKNEVEELDLNPVIVSEKNARVVDVRRG